MEQNEVDGLLDQGRRGRSRASDSASNGAGGTNALMILAGIAALGTFATLFSVVYRSSSPSSSDTLRIALDEYVAGRFDISKKLADSVTPNFETEPDDFRVREFLLGAAGVRLANELGEPSDMRLEIAAAIPHLQWLANNDFPPGRVAEGHELLGMGRRILGRYEEAIIPLEKAIAIDPTLDRKLLLPLAEAKLRATGVNASRAASDIDTFLQLPNLSKDMIETALLLRAKVEAKSQKYDQARKTLDLVDNEDLYDEIDLIRAEIFLSEAKQVVQEQKVLYPDAKSIPLVAKEQLLEAATLLEELNYRNEPEYGAAAQYLLGIVYRTEGRNEEALAMLSALRQNSKNPTEAIAAGLEEIELLAEMKLFNDALQVTGTIVKEIGDPVTFDPLWISLAELQTRLQIVGSSIQRGGGFAESIDYARALPPVIKPADALMMEATSHRKWGEHLRTLAQGGDEEARLQSRDQFREAGRTFAKVAELVFEEPEYMDFLWDAIDAYQQGRAFEESLSLLEPYLRYETRTRMPRGLIARGKCSLALSKNEEAIESLTECMEEYPRDPLSYEARLLSAVAHAELGNIDKARELLEANVFDEWLAPESPIYRDSLFALGDLLYRRAVAEYLRLTTPTLINPRIAPGDQPKPEAIAAFNANQSILEAAINRLEDAEKRDLEFQNVRRSRRAAYIAAEAHHLAAFWPGIQAADPDTLQYNRNRLNQQRAVELKKANDGFTKLRTQLLSEHAARNELLPWEQSMLRNCYMGIADTLFELGDFVAASAAYQKASQEFMNEPLALEALIQQSRCYEQIAKLEKSSPQYQEAASVLDHIPTEDDVKNLYKKAASILDRIPTDLDSRFSSTTRYDRKDWTELLDWLQGT